MKLKSKKPNFKLYVPCVTKQAVTLIELLIAVALVGIISVPLAVFLSRGTQIWFQREKVSDITNNASLAMNRMTRELRHAAKDSITIAESDEIEFEVDLDKDGENETIKYDVSGSDLRRTQDSGTAYTIAESISSLTIQYYNSSGTELVPPGGTNTQKKRKKIRYIKITLDMPENVSLESKVYLKNFKTYE